MPALWGDSRRVICFPGNSVLLEMIGSGLSSRRKEKITPSCKGRGADESAHLRQQQTPTTTSMFTGTHLSSRCTLVSIYQEYSQMQAPGCFTGHNSSSQKTDKTANSVKWKSRSSSSTSQTGWGKNLSFICKLDIGQRALNILRYGGTCRRNRKFTLIVLGCG